MATETVTTPDPRTVGVRQPDGDVHAFYDGWLAAFVAEHRGLTLLTLGDDGEWHDAEDASATEVRDA